MRRWLARATCRNLVRLILDTSSPLGGALRHSVAAVAPCGLRLAHVPLVFDQNTGINAFARNYRGATCCVNSRSTQHYILGHRLRGA